MKKLFYSALIAAFLVTFAGCDEGSFIITDRPNAPYYVRPANPYADGIWIDGDWVWASGRYTWREGHWDRPRGGRVWVGGSWTNRGNGYTWTRGHWGRR